MELLKEPFYQVTKELHRFALAADRGRPGALLVYFALVWHRNADLWCFPGLKTIAELSGLGTRTVTDKIQLLVDVGLIWVACEPGAGNAYRILRSDEMTDLQASDPLATTAIPLATVATPKASDPLATGARPPSNHCYTLSQPLLDPLATVARPSLLSRTNEVELIKKNQEDKPLYPAARASPVQPPARALDKIDKMDTEDLASALERLTGIGRGSTAFGATHEFLRRGGATAIDLASFAGWFYGVFLSGRAGSSPPTPRQVADLWDRYVSKSNDHGPAAQAVKPKGPPRPSTAVREFRARQQETPEQAKAREEAQAAERQRAGEKVRQMRRPPQAKDRA